MQHGHTVFAISYRNADASMRDVTLDDYLVSGPSAALDAVEEITGADEVNIVGLCLGGTLTAMLLAHLEKTAAHRVRSATLLNTLIDFSEPGVLGAFTDPDTIERVVRKMRKTGFLSSDDLARTFTFLRGNDLVWNYVVNNWLLGKPVPAFDIRVERRRNADAGGDARLLPALVLRTERLRAGSSTWRRAHRRRGHRTDTFILAAVEDHIVPWTSSYASTRLLSGDVRFVLSSAGHIAGIVNPPNPKSRYWTNDELLPAPMPGAAAPSGTRVVVGGVDALGGRAKRRTAQAAAARKGRASGARRRPRGVHSDLIAHSTARFAWYS